MSANERNEADEARPVKRLRDEENGAMGYILLWILGVPASVLFLIFLMRGCT